jgi:cytochrome c oxidase subunit II
MGGKRDVIPNRITEIVFTPLEAGVYLGQCAEFCGESHALMKMRLIAHEPEEFERWLANEARPRWSRWTRRSPRPAARDGGRLRRLPHRPRHDAQFGRAGPT